MKLRLLAAALERLAQLSKTSHHHLMRSRQRSGQSTAATLPEAIGRDKRRARQRASTM